MKKTTFILLALLALALPSCGQQPSNPAVQTVQTAVFKQELANADVQLVDVRTPEEYAQGHLADAINMDFYAGDFQNQLKTLDPKKPVLVYCRSGGRSGNAANMLGEMGFEKVIDLQGGITAWQAAGEAIKK